MKTRGIRCALVVAVTAGLVPGVLQAQSNALDRGHFAVDGQASLISGGSKGDNGRQTALFLSPSALYFVRSGLAVGGAAAFGHTSGGGASYWTFSVGPQAVIYFGEEKSSVRPFLRADVGVGWTRTTRSASAASMTGHVNLSHVAAAAGVLDLLTSSVGIHGELFYRRDSYGGDLDSWADQFGAAFGFSIFLGG